MDRFPNLHGDGLPVPCSGSRHIWSIALLGLVIWQAWMTFTLFGSDRSWQSLLDNQPIVSGRHPLHLYHGYLGALSLRERGTLCCYDPAFQAGYPKTPVFDSGSRPAELFLSLAGGKYRPSAYKIGLAVCCLAVPLSLFLAARGIGLGSGTSCLATAGGLLVWWGHPCRQLLEAGDVDFLIASLAAVFQAGMLIHFHEQARVRSWIGLFAANCLGWFGQPLLFAALLPLTLVYYLSVGAKHRFAWHIFLLAGLAGGVVANSFWLFDWFANWWIRTPLQLEGPLLPHRTLHTIWQAPLWGDGPDRILAVVLLGAGLFGTGVLNQTNRRPAARLLGLGGVGFLFLAIAGISSEPLGRLGTARLVVPALWFAVVPAAHALSQVSRFASSLTGNAWRGAAVMTGLLAIACFAGQQTVRAFVRRCANTAPLAIGLSSEDQAWIQAIDAHTTPEARILWEDRSGPDGDSHWTALLPLLTNRAYIGGLDPEACIDHAYASFVEQKLVGRPLASWSDAELSDFCRRYDVGWVACRSPAAVARFRAWKEAEPLVTVTAGDSGSLFRLKPPSFALKGQARLIRADCRCIALADVAPAADGEVILSLHYQAGLRASPSRVQVEKQPDSDDPVPFLRLRVPGPVARLTLTWQER